MDDFDAIQCEDYYGEEFPPIIQLDLEQFYSILDKDITNENRKL
jgi:hypothetical protein